MSPLQLVGPEAIHAALDRGDAIYRVLVAAEPREANVEQLVARARSAGIPVQVSTDPALWRYKRVREHVDVLALVGRNPNADLEEVFSGNGAVWLLVGIAYGTNAGFAIRTAEVSGAMAVAIDADFNYQKRREALRASIRADLFLPVFWTDATRVLDLAKRSGFRCIAIEDSGDRAPWELDLTGRIVLVIGGEKHGIPPSILERCDAVTQIPMRGFIPSYNLQAAVAAVATERLRQCTPAASPARAPAPSR